MLIRLYLFVLVYQDKRRQMKNGEKFICFWKIAIGKKDTHGYLLKSFRHF